MEDNVEISSQGVLAKLQQFIQKLVISIIAIGPMPKHIAFIMDGNRRYAKARGQQLGAGHRVGFSALISNLWYCYEMGVEYVTVYAFSIDNFNRDKAEVQYLMDLMEEKFKELMSDSSVLSKFNCRVNFWGNLDLLSDPVREAANNLVSHTWKNTGPVLSVCLAYTSTEEIVHAAREVIEEQRNNGLLQMKDEISVSDLERKLYSCGCPDPDIIIRTSGETRLSNFLLWQSTFSHLQNPAPLWPECTFRHVIWGILEYQRVFSYLESSRRFLKKKL